MTEEQLREYEALAGVSVTADADELECAWAIDALVAEVRRLRAAFWRICEGTTTWIAAWQIATDALEGGE